MDTAPGPRRKSAFENVFAQSLIAWRFLGAYACQAGICVVCMMGVSILKALVGVLPLHALRGGVGLQSWRWWLLVLSMQAAMGPAVLAFVLALDTKDMLVGIGKYDAYIPSFVSSRLVKIAGRVSSGEGCARQLVALGLRAVSGAIALDVMRVWFGTDGGYRLPLLGVACAVAHHLHSVFWSRDVLVFPSTGAHRWRRWQKRVPSIVQRIVPVAIVACGWYAGLVRVTGSFTHSVGHPGLGSLGSLGSLFCGLSYAAMLLVMWSFGDSMADIVMTERPRLGDYGSKKVLAAMEECLNGARGDLMQHLALYDLSLVPSDGETAKTKKLVWRRQQIFAEETGALWSRLGGVCMDPLAAIVVSVERIEELSSKLKAKNGASNATKWNSMPSHGALAGSEVSSEAVHSLLEIAGNHQTIMLSIRFLSDMAYVSVDEDRYGVLQLSEPSLGDVLFMLVRTDQKIRQLGQWVQGVVSVGGLRWRASGEELYSFRRADACLDVVRREIGIALENLASVFGTHTLVDVLEANPQFKAAERAGGSERVAMMGVLLRSTTGSEMPERRHRQ
jgi:hypothetical protein